MTSLQAFYCTDEKRKCEKNCFCNYRSYPCQHIDQWRRKTRESTTALETTKTKARVRIKRVKSDSSLTYGQSLKHEIIPPPPLQINSYVLWKCNMGCEYLKKLRQYTNSKHFIAVDLILKHNRKGSRLGRVRYIIYSTDMKPTLWRHMKRCHGRLHYDRKFKIFIFLFGYINVNKCFLLNNYLLTNKRL
jgi:hypothetical protein